MSSTPLQNHSPAEEQFQINEILKLGRQHYDDTEQLQTLIDDVVGLFRGQWPSHESCQTKYHNLHHALDVALVTSRMIVGWNLKDTNMPIPKDIYLNAIAAALFHDAGYIKDKGDDIGSGGKYSFTHVQRSMDIARDYLSAHNWSENSVRTVPDIIALTEFYQLADPATLYDHFYTETVARMLAVADLIAQMADVDYMKRIHFLFEELQEAYYHTPNKELQKLGIHIYQSAEEMQKNTASFYQNFVVPRFQDLGRMDLYLSDYFGKGRNPYLENIAANLSDQIMGDRVPWYRLGEVLERIEAVTSEQISEALSLQQHEVQSNDLLIHEPSFVSRKLAEWQSQEISDCHLGNILIQMKAISPDKLREGLIAQILPPECMMKMEKPELAFLLKASMLLQNLLRDNWVLGEIMEMTNKHLGCEASSILLADHQTREMLVAVATGPQKEQLQGKTISIDKGLAGWVHRHRQPAIVRNVQQDYRFDESTDEVTGFSTRSILAVPLHIKGQFVGVMELINKDDDNFSKYEIDILILLANIIAVSLNSVFQA